MILSCPSCSAQYFADDKAIGENGRTVRCAACGHSWFARPELSLEEKFNASDLSREKVERIRQKQDAPDVAPHQAIREKEFARKESGSRVAALAAWTGSAAIFFGLGAGAVVMRDDVVKFWPEASSAYAMAGLDVNRYGLEFGPVDAERTFDGTTPILNLSGVVTNPSDKAHYVPELRIDLRDDNGRNVDSVLITLDQSMLAPGEEGRFMTRIDSPPLEAFDLAMSFVEPPKASTQLADIREDAQPATHTETHGDDGQGDTASDAMNATGDHDAAEHPVDSVDDSGHAPADDDGHH